MVAATQSSMISRQENLVESNLVGKAVNALLKHHESEVKSAGDKKQLLGDDQAIHVQFNLTRIPEHSSISARPIRIEIPHSLNKLNKGNEDGGMDDGDNDGLDEAEVCLIVKDSSKEWVQTLISQFPKEMSYVKKVLSLTSLRKKYTQYQDRRTLCNSYSLFLVDDAILPMVGKLLGKSFFMKKKQPVPVKLSRKESLPFAIEKCIKSTFLMIGAGTCVSIKAAATTMSSGNICDNIQAVVQNAISHIPRKASNVSSISIKTDSSIALPIYNKVREELETIEKLAKVDSSNTASQSTSSSPSKKKRGLDKDDADDDKTEGETNKNKKLKKADTGKSPLLKALKKSKKMETQQENNTEKKSASKDDTPKQNKKKKRTSSEIESVTASSESDKKIPEAKNMDTPSGKQKKKLVKDDSAGTESSGKEKATFIASKKFKGSKKGYVFKKDKQGVGYYIDQKPVPNKAALEALTRSNKGKGRRQSTGKVLKKGNKKKRRSSY